MTDISLWKRVGGWLRRSQSSPEGSEVTPLDAEGMLISPSLEEVRAPESERTSALVRPSKKEDQLTAMEEGFGRLVDVLEAINDNVSENRRHSEEFKGYLAELSDSVRAMPDSAARQEEAAKQLNEELRSQAVRQQQLVEMMQNLPDLNEAQVEKLEDIRQQLSAAAEGDARLAESLHRFDEAAQGMLQNSDSQTSAVKDMASGAQKNAQQLQIVLAKQNRRLMWLVMLLLIIVLGAVAGLVWLLLTKAG